MNEEILVTKNINLIYLVIHRLHLSHRIDDYYDVGLIALVNAAKKFDSSKGYNFSTFAIKVITNSFLHEIRKENTKKRKSKEISLNKPIISDEKIIFLEDCLKSDVDIEKDLIKKEEKELMYNSILKLDKREQLVINHLYGLNGSKKLTQKELGKKLNISQTHISRIKNDSIRKIKEMVGA